MSGMNAFAVGILLIQPVAAGVLRTLGHANLRSNHDAAAYQERRAQQEDYYLTYYCVEPEGQLSEYWRDNANSPSGESCFHEVNTCCGPLQNISYSDCSASNLKYVFPGEWSNNVCMGYSVYDCCFNDNVGREWTFTACYDTHVKILNNWVGDNCTAYSYRTCCAESSAPSPSAPTVTPTVFSGSRSVPTSSSSFDLNDDTTEVAVSGILFFVLWIVLVSAAIYCACKKSPSTGTTTPNLPENKITSSATSAGTSSPSATVQSKPSAASDHTTSESNTESSNSGRQVEQLAAKIKESIHNSGGAALTVEQISALLKESIPNAGAAGAAATTTGGGANVVGALNDVTGTLENVTASASNILEVASLFEI